ncbi:MAG: PQQ-binding-like beta-propeller repeat protein [Planctomycetota bacterium]|nr:PQQ-binding-like beta-propeller repeat protein [Planctomycetota bacterium]
MHHSRSSGLCLLLALLPVAQLAAADVPPPRDGLIASPEPGWPQWRGPRRDGVSDERGLLPSWPAAGPKLVWKLGELGQGWSSPIVVGKTLFITGDVGDHLVIFAFDRDGRLKWRVKNGPAWKGSYPGARVCCAYADGQLYHINAHGRLACLEAASGKELWADDMLRRFQAENITWAVSECLLVDGPRVLVTPGGKQALMAALDRRTGQTVWTTPPLGEDRATYSSPILFRYAGRRFVANCTSTHGFGVEADTGKLAWTLPLRNRHEVTVATPVYGDGALFYATPDGPNGQLHRLLVRGADTHVEQAWGTVLDPLTGGAVLVDGTLYGSGYRKFKHWFVVDWKSGVTKSELKDLTTGAATYADGRLYCLAEDGRAALLKPTQDGLEIVGQMPLVADKVRDAWAHPVLLDGRLYLRYHDSLWCYDVRAT